MCPHVLGIFAMLVLSVATTCTMQIVKVGQSSKDAMELTGVCPTMPCATVWLGGDMLLPPAVHRL